jgi:hypothetical protein
MGGENLANYYQTNFSLMQHHKYDLETIENMMPFERELYIMLLSRHIEDVNQQAQLQSQQRGRR